MSSPFTQKQQDAINTGLKACNDCAQVLQIVRQIGVPNETLEAQNEYMQTVLQKAKELHDQFANGEGSK